MGLPIRQKGKKAIISQQKGNNKATKKNKNENTLKGTRGMAEAREQWPKPLHYVSRIRMIEDFVYNLVVLVI
jgi:hypothetical protein